MYEYLVGIMRGNKLHAAICIVLSISMIVVVTIDSSWIYTVADVPPPYPIRVQYNKTTGEYTLVPDTSKGGIHWYAGSVSNWILIPVYATDLEVTIRTPASNPPTSDFYYVLLSCWDVNASYNQIGIAAHNGHWGFTYSRSWFTPDGEMNFDYNPSHKILNVDTEYRFRMTLNDNGVIRYRVYEKVGGDWILKHKLKRTTGGAYFYINNFIITDYGVWIDYTNYEEVYRLGQNHDTPTFDFRFDDNKCDGLEFTAWSIYHLFVDSPPGIIVTEYIWLYYTTIDNPDG